MVKKYLMRGAIDVFENHTKIEMAVRDYIGSNSGNMLYAYSVFRMLTNVDTKVDVDHYSVERNVYTNEDICRINETYEAYILPLADAFRDDYVDRLNNYAVFIEKLAIPCYVIGVGIREDYEPDFSKKHVFDKVVVRFIKAVLAKSSIVGIRGAITGKYLNNLGFVEDKDYMVIGCPSLFTYGKKLTQRALSACDKNINIAINFGRGYADKSIAKYLYELSEQYENYQYIAQETSELRTYVAGINNMKGSLWYPGGIDHKFYRENKVRFYIDPISWVSAMKSIDLSIGGRFHGNVAAILGGAPAILFLVDARTRELAEYLHIPCLPMNCFDWNQSLESVIEKIDLQSHLKVYEENFERYIKFLRINGIKFNFDSVELEKNISDISDNICSFAVLTELERIERTRQYAKEKELWTELRLLS